MRFIPFFYWLTLIFTILLKEHVFVFSKIRLFNYKFLEMVNIEFGLKFEKDQNQNFWTGACIIKLIMAVICNFRNKLECLNLNTRLGRKITETVKYGRNKFDDTGPLSSKICDSNETQIGHRWKD